MAQGLWASAAVSFGLLFGDVNQNGTVNSSDLQQVRMNIGRGRVDGTDFINDVTVDAHINHVQTDSRFSGQGSHSSGKKRPYDAIAWSFTLHDAVLGDVGAAVFPG